MAALLATLVAALTLESSMRIEVPYLSQTDGLCGGAAAAMVFRYWGDAHADVQQFATLVDRRAGGIADEALVRSVRERGWRVERFDGSMDELATRLADRQPVIVLLAESRRRYHYVVVTGLTAERVIVHDPSRGPARAIDRSQFLKRWQASRFWSLVILPAAAATKAQPASVAADDLAARDESGCGAVLTQAIRDIRERIDNGHDTEGGLDAAEKILQGIRTQCPASAGPLRELAAVRFAQKRWADAAGFARRALKLDHADPYTLDLLGASLFLQDDVVEALRAWNQIGKPKLDSLRIEGLHHAGYQAITQALDLRPTTLLTADTFARASRRLDELPDRAMSRLDLRPDRDGYASLDVILAERTAVPRGRAELLGVLSRAAVDREATWSLPGFTGHGEVWSASWRWWNNRPRVTFAFVTPRSTGLVGTWRVEASWQVETYKSGPYEATPFVRESRTHGGLTVSDWLTGHLRYALHGGFDAWSNGPRAASFGAALERRWFVDRLALSADATTWMPVSNQPRFHAAGARAIARSSADRRAWILEGTLGVERASDYAPLGLWPGVGEARTRGPLLRAHPLLANGIIDVADATVGRTIRYGSAEMQRWLSRPRLACVGIAAFIDTAHSSRRAMPGVSMQADVGVGLRVRVPGVGRLIRVDAAQGIRDGARAVTLGWGF